MVSKGLIMLDIMDNPTAAITITTQRKHFLLVELLCTEYAQRVRVLIMLSFSSYNEACVTGHLGGPMK